MSDYDDAERSYRRGYTHGAQAVIDAVGLKLPISDRKQLMSWFEDEVRKWRLAAYTGDSKRTANKGPTVDIAPPTASLKNSIAN